MADSNSNSYGIRVPKYNGKGGPHFTMFKMKFKAYLAEKKLAEILLVGFKATLPDAEDTILDEGKENEKKQLRARELNAKGIHALIQALETPELMDKIMLEQMRDTKWPSGKFSDMWKAINEDEQPNDVVAEMSMLDDLRKLRLPRTKDPKTLRDAIAAIEVQYEIPLTETRKTAVVLRAGASENSSVMATLGTVMQLTNQRDPTSAEYITEMHKQFRIEKVKAEGEKKTKKKSDEDENGLKTALGEVGAFTAKCYGCGKTGHKKADCPSKKGGGKQGKKESPNNMQGSCNHCGFKGHKEAQCWKLHPELRSSKDRSGACIEILVSTVEGLEREKELPTFTVFNFINDESLDLSDDCDESLGLSVESSVVVREEVEEPVKAEKYKSL